MEKNIKIIMMEPLYQINLGYVARVAANFGAKNLYLVNPRCNYKGKEAIKYSKHAFPLLKKAKIYKSLDAAVKGSTIVVGTTGLWHKSDDSFFNVYTADKINQFTRKQKEIALIVGRDDIGLTKDELKKCDFSIFIPANRQYPILNISHALAILLYELNKEKFGEDAGLERFYADNKSMEGLVRLFSNSIKERSNIKNKKAVTFAFEHVLKRSRPTRKEINAISIALSNKYKTEKIRKRN
jgi:tRNA/rRNA methyltransferase